LHLVACPILLNVLDLITDIILRLLFITDIQGMRRIMTFRSMTDRIYDGGPIRL
jgi:hypothetical protein